MDDPVKDLQPSSWIEAEVDAIEGRRLRFHDGRTGTVKNAVSFGTDNKIHSYGVEVTPDGGQTILLCKDDAERGDWAFTILPGPPVSEEGRAALPEWGQTMTINPELGLKLLRDHRVPIRPKLIALGIGVATEILQLPAEGIMAALLPFVGAAGDLAPSMARRPSSARRHRHAAAPKNRAQRYRPADPR
jgi:hypothetical protein